MSLFSDACVVLVFPLTSIPTALQEHVASAVWPLSLVLVWTWAREVSMQCISVGLRLHAGASKSCMTGMESYHFIIGWRNMSYRAS